jgi:hypothetical protein
MGTVLQLQMDKGRKTPRTDNGKDESSAAGKDGLPPPVGTTPMSAAGNTSRPMRPSR